MSASLVGSEMCIRDRVLGRTALLRVVLAAAGNLCIRRGRAAAGRSALRCLRWGPLIARPQWLF
eukprot:5280415-Alexandrium_andersonii.AAC.1